MDTLERITQTPGVMGGNPCIRGMRVTVGMIVGQLAGGRSIDDLLADFPYLEREDVVQALRSRGAWQTASGNERVGKGRWCVHGLKGTTGSWRRQTGGAYRADKHRRKNRYRAVLHGMVIETFQRRVRTFTQSTLSQQGHTLRIDASNG